MGNNSWNIYTCDKGHKTLTKDIDSGTTPFMIECRHKGCESTSYSCFYSVNTFNILKLATEHGYYEWYMPKNTDGMDEETKEHIKKGGLILADSCKKIQSPVCNMGLEKGKYYDKRQRRKLKNK